MKVGIDITSVMYNRGVSRYTSNLVRALAVSPGISLSLYGYSLRQKSVLQQFCKSVLNTQSVIESYPPSVIGKLWGWGLHPVSSELPGIEVFHSWDWLQPPDKKLPLVSTIHDVAILKYPETAHPSIVAAHRKAWDLLKKRNAQIIAVSQATRKDCIELLDFNPDQVHVVYEALPTEAKNTMQALTEPQYESTKQHLGLDKPFLLCVGTREPRKNLLRVIEAWEPLSKEYELVIAGAVGWDETSLKNQHMARNVRFLGPVSDRELAVLYSEATIFVYPSLYEGFGLPILESFYHGTPVVTSTISSMPEVAGNAAELVDPMSVESIRAGITNVLSESKVNQEVRLKRMILRLQLFDWRSVAGETVRVYKKAVAQANL